MAGAHGGERVSGRETEEVTRPLATPTRVVPAHGSLGLPQGIALYIGSVLGTGLLVLPGIAAQVAGPASIVAVIAVIVLSIPLAGTFAALAARFPDPGGVASYARRALGPTAARMTGYWFLFGVCAGAPVVAMLGGEYVAAVVGADRAVVPVLAVCLPRAALRGQRVRRARGRMAAARAHRAAAGRRGRGRGAGRTVGGAAELRALPPARLGGRRHRDQPLRVGVRRVGSRHARLRGVPRRAAHHPDRDRGRPRRDGRLLPGAADRHGRRARRGGRSGKSSPADARRTGFAGIRLDRRRGDRGHRRPRAC